MVVQNNPIRRLRRLFKRKIVKFTTIIILSIFLITHFHKDKIFVNQEWNTDTNIIKKWDSQFASKYGTSPILKFHYEMFAYLKKFKPMDPPKDKSDFVDKEKCIVRERTLGDTDGLEAIAYNSLLACHHLPPTYKENLKEMHSKYVNLIKTIPKSVAQNLFQKDKGIVTVGGGKFSLILTTMLPMLRSSENTSPVEIFIPQSDEKWEEDFCNKFAPKYNAKCIYMSDYFPEEILQGIEPSRYQYKLLALLASQFKELIFLDADSYAVTNIDVLFDKPIYKRTGLVLWPDLWRRHTSPDWYDVANVPYNITHRVRYAIDDLSPVSRYTGPGENDVEYIKEHIPFHDLEGTLPDLSSESGQFIMNKVEHFDTLLLTLYYNIWGPDYYYRLMTEGGSGEGDKDTFIAAVFSLGKPYYQVKTPFSFSAYATKNKGFQGVGLIQHDMQQDYDLYVEAKKIFDNEPEKFAKYDPDYRVNRDFGDKYFKAEKYNNDRCDATFIHASFAKFSPLDIKTSKHFLDDDGETHMRGYSNTKLLHKFSEFEMINFQQMYDIFCDPASPYKFPYFDEQCEKEAKKQGTTSEIERAVTCKYVTDHIAFLKAHPLEDKK